MAGAAGAIKAGGAYVEVSIRDKASQQLKTLGQRIQKVGAGISMAGAGLTAGAAAVAGPFLAMVKQFASAGDNLNKMSARTGVSVEALSSLGFAAEQSGADLAALETGLSRMQRTIGDAARGMAGAADSLAQLGLSMEDLNGLSPEEQFKLIAQRLSSIEDPTLRAAAAMSIFGRSGTKLLPLIANGAAGIEELQKEAEALGITLSTEDAQAAADFTDAMNRVVRAIKGTALQIGGALAPALTEALGKIKGFVTYMIEWVKANKTLVVNIAKGAAVIGAAGVALTSFGLIVSVVGTGIAGLGTLIGGAFAVITTVLGAVLSPIGLVVAAVAGLGVAWATMTENGKSTVASLMTWFGQLKDYATQTWQGIAAALKAGDLKLAAKIAWIELKLVWERGIDYLSNIWNSFADGAVRVFDSVVTWIRTTWAKLTGWLGKQIAKVIAFFTGEDPAEMAAAVQQMTDSQVAALQNEKDAREKERQAAADARKERNSQEIEALKKERDGALQEARDLAKQAKSEAIELAKPAADPGQAVDGVAAKQAQIDSVEFGAEAFKKFDENRRGLEEKMVGHLASIDRQMRNGGVVLAEAGA